MTLQRNSAPQRTPRPAGRGHQQRTVEARPRDQSWPGTLMVLGIFVLLASFWWAGTRTLISYMELARWFALFAFVGNLLPYTRVGLALGMERLEWFLFNLLAVGPLVLSSLLWLNLLVHGEERTAITAYAGDFMELRSYWMANDELPPQEVVTSTLEQVMGTPPMGAVGGHYMGTAKGILGYQVVTTYERILPPMP
ncbi:MAG: hypothetical protein JNN32_12415 [Flavobacteriales bacterium]|nr:hypothetical protein [Flavobacteriales bacterium]